MNTFHQGEPGLPSFWNNFHGSFPIREKISFIVGTNVLQLYRTDIPSVYIPPVGAKHALSCVVLNGCLFYLGDVSLPQFKVYIVCTNMLVCTWYVPQFKILGWSCMFCCAMDFSPSAFVHRFSISKPEWNTIVFTLQVYGRFSFFRQALSCLRNF